MSKRHQLWLNLSSALGDGDFFDFLRRMLYSDISVVSTGIPDSFRLTLPSDKEWRNKIYLQLVEKQRKRDAEKGMHATAEPPQPKLHDWNILPKKKKKKKKSVTQVCKRESQQTISDNSSNSIRGNVVTWTVWDLAKAGTLLSDPPGSVTFEDEQEMRVVYTLIYDVFRYKNIMNQALNDVGFFTLHPHLQKCIPKVWLLSYDLYHRNFKKRDSKLALLAKTLFRDRGLLEAEEALWSHRVKLAAAVARLRIKNSALRLHDLLPKHLRNDVTMKNSLQSPVTCWVNIAKVKNMNEIQQEILRTLNIKSVDGNSPLLPETFQIDKVCPFFITFHSSLRTLVTQSHLVLQDRLIVQDRSFSFGPATFSKAVSDLELTGSVIQSHVNSPRTTAYLASILSQNQKIKKLMAFSAGQRKKEYEKYFQQLGMTNIVLHSDRLIDSPPDASYLEEVVAVFATPPNSYSAVSDPVDLVCGRGGDLSMLEVLTETEETTEGRKRVAAILEEQKKTLQFAMSRPQIQLVLYETHSELKAENDEMVQTALQEVNKTAKIQHASLQGKLNVSIISETESTEINNNESLAKIGEDDIDNVSIKTLKNSMKLSGIAKPSSESISSDDVDFKNVLIPETDIFETPKLPDLCPNEDACVNLSKEGCYLSLIKRKQVIRMDNKYMIEMAESRGLFGDGSNASRPTQKTPKKNQEPGKSSKTRRKTKTIEIDRIAAPTQSSSLHSRQPPPFKECPRHAASACVDAEAKVKQSRMWWTETAHHLKALRSSLVRQRILPPLPLPRGSGEDDDQLLLDAQKVDVNIDEFAARNRDEVKRGGGDKGQVFPKLRLTRPRPRNPQIRVPVAVPGSGIAMIRYQWNKYKEKYVDRAIHEVRYFERAMSLPLSAPQKQPTKQRNMNLTEHEEILDIPTTSEKVTEKEQEVRMDNDCCSRSVEQQCSDTMIERLLLHRKPKDPYSILNSLTSQQIRRLISTSYNACFQRSSNTQRVETASKKSQISASTFLLSETPANKQKKKKFSLEAMLKRLSQPTQASLMKKTKEMGLVRRGKLYTRVFICDKCRVRNGQECSACYMQK